jgi:hypothetical protein
MLQVEAPMMASIKQLEATLVGERQFEELAEPIEVKAVVREWHPESDDAEEPGADPEPEEADVAESTGAEMREPGADPDRERCTKGWKTLIGAKSKFRCKELGLDQNDEYMTLLNDVLTSFGIPNLDDVCLDEQEAVTEAVENYELPQ